MSWATGHESYFDFEAKSGAITLPYLSEASAKVQIVDGNPLMKRDL